MVESYMVYIVMGVSGSGKSTFGKLLAKQKGIPFIDADDVHPPENIRKMREGIPLDDRDRQPWLERLAEILEEHEQDGVVLACSALKASYRTTLTGRLSGACLLVYLRGTYDTIHRMISQRSGHFFSPDMLKSQFADLEEPEGAFIVGLDDDPVFSEIVKVIP